MDTRSESVFSKLITAIEKNKEKKVKKYLKENKEKILTHRVTYKDASFAPIEYAALLNKWDIVNLIASLHKENSKASGYGSALIYAIEAGELNTIKTLLEANASIEWHRTGTKNNLLHLAFLSKNYPVIHFLLNYNDGMIIKKNFKSVNNSNQTPMVLAASIAEKDQSFFNIIEQFANLTSNENNKNDKGNFGYALCIAVKAEKKEVVKSLLRAGADIDYKDSNGKNAFDLAENNPEILTILADYLINNFKVTEKNERLAIDGKEKAFGQKQKEIIMNIRKKIEKTNKENNNALCAAVIDNNVEGVKSLLNEKNVDFINDNGDSPISLAVKNDNDTILKLLLDKIADHNLKKDYDISKLIFTFNAWKCMKFYLNRSNLNSTISSERAINSFIKAIQENQYSIVQLLSQKCAIRQKIYNLVDQDGNTPLHHAIQKDRVEIVKLLLTFKADTSIKNNQNMNALEWACYLNRGNCAIELINNNAVCSTDALQFAVQNQNQEITFRILEKENNLDLYKYDIEKGNIFIYEANKNDNIAILELLLKKINLANVHKTQDGKTPLMLAQDSGKFNCYNLLKRHADYRTFLEKMKKEIAETPWKIKISGIFWNGYPNHITEIKEKLEKLANESEIGIQQIFQDIYTILNNLKTSEDADRHPTTITFDQNNKIEMRRIQQQNNNNQQSFNQAIVKPPTYSQFILSQQASAPLLTNYHLTNYPTSTWNDTYVNPCQIDNTQIFLLYTDKGNFLLQTDQPFTDDFCNLINSTIGFSQYNDFLSYTNFNLPLISLPSISNSTPFDNIDYIETDNAPLPLRTSQIFSQAPPHMTLFPRCDSTINLKPNTVSEERVPQFNFINFII